MHVYIHFDIDIRYLKNIPDIFPLTIITIKFFNPIYMQ